MIQVQTVLEIIDNTGAKTAKCIKILSKNTGRYALIGDYILVCIKSIR